MTITARILGREGDGGVPTEPRTVRLQFDDLLASVFPFKLLISTFILSVTHLLAVSVFITGAGHSAYISFSACRFCPLPCSCFCLSLLLFQTQAGIDGVE